MSGGAAAGDLREDLAAAIGHLGHVVQSLPCGLLLLDEEGRVLQANRWVEAMLGLPPEELLWRPPDAYLDPQVLRDLRETLAGGAESAVRRRVPVARRGADAPPFPATLRATLMPVAGEPDRLLVTVVDDSREQELELAAQHAERLRSMGQLAGGVVHEMTTPLQCVSQSVELLRERFGALAPEEEEEADPELEAHLRAMRELFDVSREALGELETLVRAVRGFTRLRPDEVSALDVRPVLETARRIARGVTRYVAEVDVRGEAPAARGRPSDLRQSLLNLLVNAAHAVEDEHGRDPQTGRIVVTLSGRQDRVEVAVEDNGAGVPERLRARIFEPYFTTKTGDRGTGQGLPLVRHLMRGQGGDVALAPSRPGAGARFVLWLPRT